VLDQIRPAEGSTEVGAHGELASSAVRNTNDHPELLESHGNVATCFGVTGRHKDAA
jgi:hypothetical protein